MGGVGRSDEGESESEIHEVLRFQDFSSTGMGQNMGQHMRGFKG